MPCHLKNTFLFLLTLSFSLYISASGVEAATLSVSPQNGQYNIGEIFNINIILDTQGANTYGVGIRYLNYDPSLLEVQDVNPSPGIQILPGSLYSRTQVNSVNSTQGKIEFVQLTSDGEVYNGQGVLATVTFKVISPGEASVYFDFSPSSTVDSNVADGEGNDILTNVINGQYHLVSSDVTPPSISNVASTNITQNQAVITWTTDEPSTSQVEFGLTSRYGNFTLLNNNLTTSHSVTLSGLSPNTTFHFRVRSKNLLKNEAVSKDYSFTTLGPADITPPAAINDLTASKPTGNSVVLTWTSPGDDGNIGIASLYDIRYSTFPITESNWNSAFRVIGEPIPKIAGTVQSMNVIGLTASTTYYFAI